MQVVQNVDGQTYTQFRAFTIRAKRDFNGRWKYQLNDKLTGQPHAGETWFAETVLRDLS